MLEIVHGWTEPIRMRLMNGSEIQDLTNMTVAFQAYDRRGVAVSVSGTLTVESPATAGIVKFEPSSTDIDRTYSPWKVRIRVTDTGSDVAYFPNAEADQWIIRL